MKNWILGIALIALIFQGCKEDETGLLTISLTPVHNGVEIEADELLQDEDGRNFSMFGLRTYFSDVYLVKENGDRVLADDLDLLEWPGTKNTISATLDFEQFSKIEFNIGLDATTNNSTPIDFEDSHPLSADQDMHWGMLKYRFLSFFGEVDTSDLGDQALSNTIVYHLGNDLLYSPVSITKTIDFTADNSNLELVFEVDELFNGSAGTIDKKTQRVNHSSEATLPWAQIIMSNFVESLERNN